MRNCTRSAPFHGALTISARTTPALACEFENAGVIAVLFAQFHPLLCFSSDTALLLSSCQGHPEICRLLVVSGADVNVKDDEYDAYACAFENAGVIAVLFATFSSSSLIQVMDSSALAIFSWPPRYLPIACGFKSRRLCEGQVRMS